VVDELVLQQTELAFEQSKRFVKSLRRIDIMWFIVAAVISMDTIGSIAAGGLGSLSWGLILIAIFMIPYAMLFAETGSTFPEEGGPYQWVKFAFGRLAGGITTVFYWLVTPIWLGGSLAFIAYGTFSAYVWHIPANSVGDWAFKLGYVWLSVLLAVMSLKTGKIFINVGAWAKLTTMLLLVGTTAAYGILHGLPHQHWGDLRPSVSSFLYAAPILLFSYVGFEAPNSASEEMLDAADDTGPAIRVGSAITALAYLLPVAAIVLIVPPSQASGLAGFMSAVKIVFAGVYGPLATWMVRLTGLLFVVAVVNLGSSWMVSTDRTQAMAAADGTFFGGFFGVFNERFGTPLRVNISSGIIGSLFTIAAMLIVHGSAAAAFAVVLNTAVSTLMISYLLIVPAIIVLRLKYPDRHRPYQVPGGTIGFFLMGGVVFLFIVAGSISAVAPSLLTGLFKVPYSFAATWGVSESRFELFTLGTVAAVLLLGVVGYLSAGKVRADEVPLDLGA
jgi:amino acid transporter